MGPAEDTADTAASRLRLLYQDFREHPRTGPAGRSATPAHPGAPVNLAVVDHIAASVREIANEARAANPQADPLPDRVEAVYDWWRDNTRLAPEHVQQRRDIVIHRQYLEHAIAMGDVNVIPPHRCPGCGTFGVVWRNQIRRAVCLNVRCVTKDGMARTWSLGRLAYEHVAAEKMLRECAT